MNVIVNVLIGLVVGYIVGILFASIVAFVFGFEDAARFVAIGCGLVGAAMGPSFVGRLQGQER
jgi:putative effector of murein hydrolase